MDDSDILVLQTRLLRALARREHSKAELRRKFKTADNGEVLEQLLEKFIQNGWQDDCRFAAAYLRSALSRGDGKLKIANKLRQHQICRQQITQLLATVDWQAQLTTVYQRKYQRAAKDIAEIAARRRFLTQRGFTNDDINDFLKITS